LTSSSDYALPRRETFDSSATPEVGKSVAAPKVVADIDLDALGAQIKSTVERAKENDPKALKLELAKLRQQLASRPKEQVEKIVEKIVERPAIDAKTLKETESIVERLEREGAKQIEAGNRLVEAAKLMAAALRATAPPAPRAVPEVRELRQPRPVAVATDRLPKGERRVLTAIAQFDGGLDKTHLMTLTGYKRRSRDDYVFRLKQRGFVSENGETVTATPDGVSALGDDFQPLPTGEALRSYWMQRLPQGERRVLEVLISAYPNPIAKEQIETETGYARRSRDDYLYRLGARRLVENVGRGEVKASDQLF
jgi:hypothetical protein